jgi:broad specificity phosphatase PhoE
MTELILLRHGETVGQSSIRLYGATDIALSPLGEQQAARAAAALQARRLARVVASPLQRARRSAEIVLAAQPAPAATLEVVDDLREVDFGTWEGLTWAEVEARDPDNHRLWQTTFAGFTYPGGEARPAFTRRIHAAAREIPQGPGPTLAVLHKGVIKNVIAALTGMPIDAAHHLPVPLGSLHHLRRIGDTWQLTAVGQVDHLGDLYVPD